MSATGRVRVLSDALPPPAGTSYPEGSTLRVVHRSKRAKGDFYETPAWAIQAVLEELKGKFLGAPIVLDAGCGTGAIAAAVANRFPKAEVFGVDRDSDLIEKARARGLRSAEFVTADFETWSPDAGFPDVVIMNPPYVRALEFVKRALTLVRRGGTVVALLRIGFRFGRARYDWFRKHPCTLHGLTSRPSFTGGGTDACDYAWFVWGPDVTDRLDMLPPRAKKTVERKRARG